MHVSVTEYKHSCPRMTNISFFPSLVKSIVLGCAMLAHTMTPLAMVPPVEMATL